MSNRPTVAICALFRNEARYLDEWIQFHIAMGVAHFFLYDNLSDDDPKSVLQPYIDTGLVTHIHWPTLFHQGAQKKAYLDCLERTREHFRWVAFIDLDEFLFSPTKRSLPAVLNDFAPFPGVVAHWQCYGSGKQTSADERLVTTRFTERAPTNWVRNRKVKTILNPARAIGPGSVHHFDYLDDQAAVDETQQPVRFRPKSPHKKRRKRWYGTISKLLGRWVLRLPIDPYMGSDIKRQEVTVDLLRINHYAVKSREEFLTKSQLKKERRRYEYVDYFAYHDRNDVYDPILVDWADQAWQP